MAGPTQSKGWALSYPWDSNGGHFSPIDWAIAQTHCRRRNLFPEGPRIEKIQSREAIMKKSSFQYRMKFPIGNEIFSPGRSQAAEKQGLGLKFSIEKEIFKPRMKISSENENFVRGGMVFSCVRARMNFFDPRALWDRSTPKPEPNRTGACMLGAV